MATCGQTVLERGRVSAASRRRHRRPGHAGKLVNYFIEWLRGQGVIFLRAGVRSPASYPVFLKFNEMPGLPTAAVHRPTLRLPRRYRPFLSEMVMLGLLLRCGVVNCAQFVARPPKLCRVCPCGNQPFCTFIVPPHTASSRTHGSC